MKDKSQVSTASSEHDASHGHDRLKMTPCDVQNMRRHGRREEEKSQHSTIKYNMTDKQIDGEIEKQANIQITHNSQSHDVSPVQRKIPQVLGRVFSYTEVSHSDLHLCASYTSLSRLTSLEVPVIGVMFVKGLQRGTQRM